MEFIESQHLELKQEVNNKIIEDVIAFANTRGGDIYVGINKAGDIIGLANSEMAMDQISAMIRDNIQPELYSFIDYVPLTLEDKYIIQIKVQEGHRKPYYKKQKGPTESGVYLRDGASNIHASYSQIRALFFSNEEIHFEQGLSPKQDLTFTYLSQAFKVAEIPFDQINLKSLGLLDNQDLYTNLALIVSDQAPYGYKLVAFRGDARSSSVIDQRVVRGSVFQLLEESYRFAQQYNVIRPRYTGLQRIDQPAYPDFSIREGIVNSLVHKDYSNPNGDNFLSIYENQMEIVSYGGLYKGLEISDIQKGYSQLRNPRLAFLFSKLGFMEQFGFGIPRIYNDYKGSSFSPKIEVSPNVFRLFLPNLTVQADTQLTADQEAILKMAQEAGTIRRQQVESLLEVSPATARRLLNELIKIDKLERIGSGRATSYQIKKL